MATSPKQFIRNVTVPAVAGQIGSYSTPSNYTDKLYEIILHNSHTAGVTVELWLVPGGATVAATNKLLKKVLAQDETYFLGTEQRLEPGSQIHGLASTANVVSIHVSGDRVS